MKQFQCFFTIFLAIIFSQLSYHVSAQSVPICNPTERWLDTSFPGMGANELVEMNENLYTFEFDTIQQTYTLYKYDGFLWTQMSTFQAGISWLYKSELISYDNQLYLSGYFDENQTQIPGANGIARWDSATNTWTDVGDGVNGYILDMEVYQGELYVSGDFDSVGGTLAIHTMAKWDGTSWDSLNYQNILDPNDHIRDMAVWNNKLVIAGQFNFPGYFNLAQYDPTSGWSDIGGSPNQSLNNLGVANGDLFAYGSSVLFFGAQQINRLGRWDGTSWNDMGITQNEYFFIQSMIEFNGELWVTGTGASIGGTPVENIARWDGTQWQNVTGFTGYDMHLGIYKDRLYLSGLLYSSCNNLIGHVVKLCTVNDCQVVSGNIYQDDNMNCVKDPGEWPMAQQLVNVGNYFTSTDTNGDFSILVDTGTFPIDIVSLPNYYTASCPANGYNLTLGSATNGAANIDFALTPTPNVEDLSLTMTTFFFRPGFNSRIYIDYNNDGTVSQTPQVDLTYDPLFSYTGLASSPITSQSGNVLSWSLGSIHPSQSAGLWAEINVPVSATLGDTVCNMAIITPISQDPTPGNNTDTAKSVITGSYDPNDKQVSPAGEGENGEIPLETKKLTYKIRFQNTGTDTAFTVVIRDEIDQNLDLTSMKTLGASHNWSFSFEEDRRVAWTFNNILLPDSNTNEPASHGYVNYSIELKENLPVDTRIENTAAIYFDFNEPIITNTTVSTLTEENTNVSKLFNLSNLKVWPQPAKEWVYFQSETSILNGEIHLFDIQGRKISLTTGISGNRFRIPVMEISAGVYVFKLIDEKGAAASGKLLIE